MPYMIGFTPKGRLVATIKVAIVPTASLAREVVYDLQANDEDIVHITTPDGREIELRELERRAEMERR